MLVLLPRGREVGHQSRTDLLGPHGVVHNLFLLQANAVGEMILVLSHYEVGLLANVVSNALGLGTGDIIPGHLVHV